VKPHVNTPTCECRPSQRRLVAHVLERDEASGFRGSRLNDPMA
jgi:hypothetical protein